MTRLMLVLALRLARIQDRDKALWHGVLAALALGEFVYHGALAVGDALDARRAGQRA